MSQTNNELWAHSPNTKGIAQPYKQHIDRVRLLACQYLSQLRCPVPIDSITAAATVHDTGKLAVASQQVLSGKIVAERLPVPHEDAGTLWMLNARDEVAALIVYAHHRGLPSIPAERTKPLTDAAVGMFRDPRVAARTDQELSNYQHIHDEIGLTVTARQTRISDCRGLAARIALSCLVDADHTDTAEHYGQAKPQGRTEPLWQERLARLDNHVRVLSERYVGSPRTINRSRLYRDCRAVPLQALATLPAPVGAGTTLASMAYCLRQAIAEDLRHIFIVLPSPRSLIRTYESCETL